MIRHCEICSSETKTNLHQQTFLFPDLPDEVSYQVVHCNDCGFCYADQIPDQNTLKAFYSSASHHLHAASLPAGLAAMHHQFFSFIQDAIPNLGELSVLDIGCSMGHFLNYFKQAGVKNILGLEPSVTARQMAKTHYDIDVVCADLAQFAPEEKFDLLTLSGVLEHINALDDTLLKLNQLVANGAYVFVAVPDAESFNAKNIKEPFLEFAFEHIDYFTLTSLASLFKKHGFELLIGKSEYYDFYNNHSLMAIFKKTGIKTVDFIFDNNGVTNLKEYILLSSQLLAQTNQKLQDFLQTQQPVLVWGAGAYTSRLCATSVLTQLNLLGFIDKNPQLQGKSLLGHTIYSPDCLATQATDTPILIASSVYAAEIKAELQHKHAWSGHLICL